MKIGFLGLLTIVFVVLKLCGVIAWSWIWIVSPLWLGIIFWLLIFCGVLLIAILAQSK